MKKLGIVILTGMALAVLFNATLTEAAAPVTAKLNYQGRLTDSNGVPIADGNYNIIFQIYDAESAGASVWGPETHTGVAVEDGLFSVNLGGGTPTPVTLSGIDFNKDCWLQTTVGATTYTPRQLLTAVTYALFALSAPSGSIDHGALTGLGDDDHTQYFALSQNETVTGIPAFNGGTSGSSAPFSVDSDSKVTLLNADQLDSLNTGNASGNIPVSNSTLNVNLNADMVDSYHVSSLILDGCTDCLNATEIEDIYVFNTGDTMTGQLTSTVAVGTSPFAVTSTTVNTNLNADLLDGYHVPQTGNFGNWQPHGTFIDCNTDPSYWGWNYVQGATNCPNATSTQWYRGNFSLGSNYPMRGVGGYSLELAFPRYSPGTAGVWMRTVEGGTIGGWTRIDGSDTNSGAWTLSGTNLYPDSTSYNVGIGTTGPGFKLDVQGASGLRIGNSTYDANLRFGNNDSWKSGIRVYDNGDAEMRIWHANAAGQIVLATGYNGDQAITMPTDGLFIDQNKVGIGYASPAAATGKLLVNGNVGIGTSAPNALLDVRGAAFVGSSDVNKMIKFTDAWSGYPDSTSGSEISNDTLSYKTLMIIGNKSAGGSRQVSIWDYLTVNGSENITGNLAIGGEIQANKVCRWGTNVKVIDAIYGDTDTCPAGYCAITMVNTGNTNVYPEGGAGGRGSFPQHIGDAKLLCCRCQL